MVAAQAGPNGCLFVPHTLWSLLYFPSMICQIWQISVVCCCCCCVMSSPGGRANGRGVRVWVGAFHGGHLLNLWL